jgi:hypothetical protein
LLYLQSAAGNQAVNRLLRRAEAAPAARIQRTVWVKNMLTDQIEQLMPGLSQHVVPLELLAQVLQPGDRYDEANGLVTRLSGEQIPLAALLSPAMPHGPTPETMAVEEQQTPSFAHSFLKGRQREPQMSSAKNVREMTERRKQRAQQSLKHARSGARLEEAQAARAEPELGRIDIPMAGQIDESTGQPVVAFQAEDEVHRVFVGQAGGRWQLMIASIPLPVGDFILEMGARFWHLKAKAEDRTRVIKPLPQLAKSVTNFTTAQTQADNDLIAANAVFANVASTTQNKAAAEEALARSLHRLIVVVKALAKRFGTYVNTPGKARKPKTAGYYFDKMTSAVERYRVEGLVARYQEQPDYEGSSFERDHQPHNDLIETMAALPEFAGKKMQTVARKRTLLGWSIMLHHDRHAAGRTFSNKGGQVTAQFILDLATYRAGGIRTQAEIRRFCIEYLVQSLKDDVAAMKVVANNVGNYGDIDLPVTDSVLKAAKGGPAPSLAAIAAEITNFKTRVQQQILRGEDRMLDTESEIRDYDK